MTLIECFSGVPVDDISACLNLKPEKLIYLGSKEQMAPVVARYEKLLAQRAMETVVETVEADTEEMGSLIPALRKLFEEEENCVVDLTNGDEPVIMALGAALAGLDKWVRRRVSVQKYDPALGRWKDCDGDGWVIPGEPVTLTVAELIALHGGTVAANGFVPKEHYTAEDIQAVWDYSCQDSRAWNRAITILGEFESRADSRTQVFLYLPHIAAGMKNFEAKLAQMRQLLRELQDVGVVKDESSENCLQYSYNNELLRHCTYKQGNLLEARAVLEARATAEDGEPFFQDCVPGVLIDWDGILYDPDAWIPETRNEIDLIAVRNGVPLFVSCKHGNVEEDELYKLTTVAERFGGPYARKMLIATDIGKVDASLEAFRLRARDMGIHLVAHAAKMPSHQWQNAFREAMK
ncbi:MAG: DUF1887 family protein [Ruminococcaceae bacterium]|nr:DUF1887 family protein [Oscillospiraceae bacterium]